MRAGAARWVLSFATVVAASLLPACRAREAKDTLTVLLTSDILSLDPNQEVESVTDSVLFNAFEPLVGLDENLQPATLLAASWEHPEPTRWRFQLRKGVRFHDGTELTAALVVESLNSLRQESGSEASAFMSMVQEIVAAGPLTVDIVTREPRAILTSLPFLYVTKKNAAGAFPPLVGTGPYRVREWQRGERVVLERFPDYWGPKPPVREATFVPVADPIARRDRMAGGEGDLAYSMMDIARAAPAGVEVVRKPGLTVYYVGLDLRPRAGNHLADRRVRQAMHLALDREQLVSDVLGGTASVATQPVAPKVFGFNPDLPTPHPDLSKARALLAAAGVPKGFALRFDVPRRRLALAQRVRDQLAAAGIIVELNAMSADEVYSIAEAGQSEMYFAGWDCSTGEASEFYEFNLHTQKPGHGAGNYGGYSNPQVDEIAERNAAVLDQRQRLAMLQRASAIVMEDLPLLPLFVEDDVYAVRPGVRFKRRADSEVRLSDVSLAPAP